MDPKFLPKPRFVQSSTELQKAADQAKLRVCVHCGQLGMVNAHGFLRGYSVDGTPDVVRGRRFYCSKRGRKTGCGRTMSVLLSVFIATFSVTTIVLSLFVSLVLQGLSVRSAWLTISKNRLRERSGYRLWSRISASIPHLRTQLLRAGRPPTSTDIHPLSQVLLHIAEHVPISDDTFGEFQYRFQSGIFGQNVRATIVVTTCANQ